VSKPIIPVRALLAAALKSRPAFESIEASGVLADLTDTPGDLWHETKAYYEKDGDAKSANLELVQAALQGRYTNPKHRARAQEFVAGIGAETVSVGAATDYIRAYRRERAGEHLAASLLGRRGPDDQARALQDYLDACSEPAVEVEEPGYLDAIKSRVPKEGRIRVRLKSLNERLRGGVLPGHSIIIVGRPNSGKSALAISLSVGFARDGRKVLYVGNEDPIGDLMVRAVSNATGHTAEEIERDPDGATNAALLEGLGNLVFRQLAPGTLGELERAIRTVNPQILVVDQLRNVATNVKNDNMTQKMDAVAQGIRALAHKYNLVAISVTQAGDSAEGKATLNMGDVDNSNTGIPGACDVLLMMGVTDTLKAAGLRRISLPKNKIGGIEDSFDVKLDPARSKVTSHG
jgi:archaellum biogenesis ATPase FlaH